MISDTVIKEALISAYDYEAEILEAQAASSELHVFSEKYREKMQNISRMARHRYVTVMHGRRRLALVVAAIIAIMIAATVTTIAIVRPQIFYHIKEHVDSWEYTFTQKDPEKLASGFEYKEPEIPEGYKIIEENRDAEYFSYDVYYEDKKGHFIHYDQKDIESGYSMNMTNTSRQKDIVISGNKATLFSEDDTYTILWNDGYYVYTLYGDCDKKTLVQMAESISD